MVTHLGQSEVVRRRIKATEEYFGRQQARGSLARLKCTDQADVKCVSQMFSAQILTQRLCNVLHFIQICQNLNVK